MTSARLRGVGGKAVLSLRGDGFSGGVEVLTSCPSCLQGLTRFSDDIAAGSDYIVAEMARHILGADWLPQFVEKANRGGFERVLL